MKGIDIKNVTPALSDLFALDNDGANLIGSKCSSCQTYFFPCYHEQHRPGCERKEINRILFERTGLLKSYAVQYYQAPLPFKTENSIAPYIIGMVEFNGEIQIAGIVVGCKADDLSMGMKMNTTVFELYKSEDSKSVITWAFEPLEENK